MQQRHLQPLPAGAAASALASSLGRQQLQMQMKRAKLAQQPPLLQWRRPWWAVAGAGGQRVLCRQWHR
jgi:hypothetical protein